MLVPAPIRRVAPGITEQHIDLRFLARPGRHHEVNRIYQPFDEIKHLVSKRPRVRCTRRRSHGEPPSFIPDGYAWVRDPPPAP